jgi:hypothetical protein
MKKSLEVITMTTEEHEGGAMVRTLTIGIILSGSVDCVHSSTITATGRGG